MYLYELALEIDEHSTALAARARAAGLDGAGPNTLLTAAQVAALRSGVPVPPPPAPAGSTPPPAAASGPAPAAVGNPLAWGPNGGLAAPGATLAPPPPPPGDAPRSSLAPPPAFPGGGGRGPVPVGAPTSAGGFGRTKVAMVVGAVLVLVVVFGFFFVGTDDGGARRRQLEARNAQIEAQTKLDDAAATKAKDAEVQRRFAEAGKRNQAFALIGVADAARYCDGARAIVGLEQSISRSLGARDLAAAQAGVNASRAQWQTGADSIVASTTGALQADADLYRSQYVVLMDGLTSASSPADFARALRAIDTGAVSAAAGRINAATGEVCN